MKNVQAMHVGELRIKPWVTVVVLSAALAALSSCGSKKRGYSLGPDTATETLETNGGAEGGNVDLQFNSAHHGGNQSFAFNASSISGVFLTGGGVFDRQSGFVKAGGAFRSTQDINSGPLAGCKAGEGVRWNASELLPTSGFKCSGSADEPLKTAVTDDNTVVMKVDFYRQGDGVNASFTAKMFVSALDQDPGQDGVQNVWIQGVGCAEAQVNLR